VDRAESHHARDGPAASGHRDRLSVDLPQHDPAVPNRVDDVGEVARVVRELCLQLLEPADQQLAICRPGDTRLARRKVGSSEIAEPEHGELVLRRQVDADCAPRGRDGCDQVARNAEAGRAGKDVD
jgi:hypothetical protein